MLKVVRLLLLLSLAIWGCKKETTEVPDPTPSGPDTTQPAKDTFITYIIKQGKNYCENNTYALFHQNNIRFKVIFDSSCIYSNVNPDNQADINKLYGFGDCGTFHQANSARFGWNWKDGKMHIHAYCYVDSVRIYKELGTVPLNTESSYSLDALNGIYVFTLNGKKDTMQRHCSDTVNGYKLLPYFGGDETAPHEIHIRIKEY